MGNEKEKCLDCKDGYITPSHYMSGKYQVIEIMRNTLTSKQYHGFCIFQSIKYLTRIDITDRNKSLRNCTKAKYYLDELINYLSIRSEKVDKERINPKYYKKEDSIELMDYIDDQFKDDFELLSGVYFGTTLKYLYRSSHKHGLEDLEKAKWYLDRIINILQKQEKK